MSDEYELQVTCKNVSCVGLGDKRTSIGLPSTPKPQSYEDAMRELKEIDPNYRTYIRCEKCRRTYLYSASDIFVAEKKPINMSGLSGGKKERLVRDQY